MKFKVGDKVKIRKDLKLDHEYNDVIFIQPYKEIADKDKVYTISFIDDYDNTVRLKEIPYWWGVDMLEISKEKNKEPKKPKIKLTIFEYDLLSVLSSAWGYFEFNSTVFMILKEKGYFKGVYDENQTIYEILENCEVIE